MTSTNNNTSFFKSITIVAASTIVIAGIMAAKTIVIPILLALFISIICTQPILFLEKKKIPYSIAMLIVLASIGLILSVFGGIISSSISDFMTNMPMYDEKLKQILINTINKLNNAGANLKTEQLLHLVSPGKALSLTASALGEMGRLLSDSLLIILIMVFMLLEVKNFYLKVYLIEKTFGKSLEYLNKIGTSVRHYLSIKTYISIFTGALIGFWLYLIGVEYPILWGLIAFLLNYIPNIGSLLAAIPTMLFALVQLGVGGMIWTGIAYLTVNMVVGTLIEPRIMGKGLGLSTLAVFLALIIWGFILGGVGMFLAIPLTITIKIILEQNKKTLWLAVLLGTEKETKQLINKIND